MPEFDEQKCREILDTFAKNETWLCPTHTTRKMDAFAGDPEYRSDVRRKYIGPEVLAAWDRDLNDMARVSESTKKHFKEFFTLGLKVTGMAHQHGVGILVGTDCYDTHVFPGFSYHDELQHLHEAGLSPLDILKSATIRAAEFLEMAKECGSITNGKRADLVLLRADPLSDIRNSTQIEAVIFQGAYHPQSELQEMIRGVESHVKDRQRVQQQLAQLWDAVIQNDKEQLKAALENGLDVNALDIRPVAGGNGRRALNWAAKKNHSEMIRLLLEAGAGIDLTNRSGYTPLMHAAESGSTDAAKTLIEAGADVGAKNRRGHTALDIADAFDHSETAAVIRSATSAKRANSED